MNTALNLPALEESLKVAASHAANGCMVKDCPACNLNCITTVQELQELVERCRKAEDNERTPE